MPRILLFGLYELGFRSLKALVEHDLEVVGVVTKPDPALEEQPLARLARFLKLPFLMPESPKEPAFLDELARLRPSLIAVAGYHKILPRSVLRLPRLGVVNLHGSLLPRHRGPVPWKWAILNGDAVFGATVQQMSQELDRGPILAQEACRIDPEETAESLFIKMCALAGPLLARTLLRIECLTPQEQDETQATYEGYPSDEDARLSWDQDAETLRNRIRGLNPRPGAWTTLGGVRFRVRKAVHVDAFEPGRPGLILDSTDRSLLVATGHGALSLREMSPEGEASTLDRSQRNRLGLVPGNLLGT